MAAYEVQSERADDEGIFAAAGRSCSAAARSHWSASAASARRCRARAGRCAPRQVRARGAAAPNCAGRACSTAFRQRPILTVAPLVCAHHPDFDRRLVQDAGVLPFEPVVVPAQDFIVEGMERPLQVCRPGDEGLLRHAMDFLKPLLAALQMQLVCVGVPAGARVEGGIFIRDIFSFVFSTMSSGSYGLSAVS